MAKDPAFLFYPGDYLRDTQTLSSASQVAYDRIMCEHMRNICISKQQLKFFTKRLNPEELEEIMFILTEINGGYQIEWVAESIVKRKAYSESRRNNRSNKSKKDINNISKTYDEHMENENVIENEIIDLNESEKKTVEFISDKFGITEMKHFLNYRLIYNCVVCQNSQGEELFKHFKDQIWNYFQYKEKAKEKLHSFIKFIGSPEEKFIDGGWNAENWNKKHTGLEIGEVNNGVEPKDKEKNKVDYGANKKRNYYEKDLTKIKKP